MFNIAICDDENIFANYIADVVKEYMKVRKIDYRIEIFKSGQEVIESAIKFDLIFMDIVMDGMNGLEAGMKIHEKDKGSKIIFVTSYDQYFKIALNRVHAFAYLNKPLDGKKIITQLNEVFQYIKEENNSCNIISLKVMEIMDDGNMESDIKKFNLEDIIYFEYVNRKIKIKTKNKEFFFMARMKDLVERMNEYNFGNCHQNYLVNLAHVMRVKGYELFLDNKEKIPISQKKSAEFRKKLNKYINDIV